MLLFENKEKTFTESKICFFKKKILFLFVVFCSLVLYYLSGRDLQPIYLNFNSVLVSEKPAVNSSSLPCFSSYQQIHRIKQELLHLFEFISEEESLSHNEQLKEKLLQRKISLDSTTDDLIDQLNLKAEAESKSLQVLAQQIINKNQEPKESCNNRRKLIVRKIKYCGIGCVVHHMAKCFLIALGTNRTFLIEDSSMPDFIKNLFHDGSLFEPISRKCSSFDTESVRGPDWKGSDSAEDGFEATKHQNVICKIAGHGLHRSTLFSFHTIPKPFKESLERFHGNPAAWWSGQVLSYLLRLQPETAKTIQDFQRSLNFTHPIVGIHVRRTDKISKQDVQHQLQSYMMFAEEWFRTLEWKESRKQLKPVTIQRRVYLATDEPNVAVEFRQKYPNYQLIHDDKVTEEATVEKRRTVGPEGIIKDIFTLIECDYLVLGYESNIARLVYPLLQTKHVDASEKAAALGWPYHHLADYKPYQIAIANHTGKTGELSFIVGDIIDREVRAAWKRGYWTGTNNRTKEKGVYPAFKVILHQFTAPYKFDL